MNLRTAATATALAGAMIGLAWMATAGRACGKGRGADGAAPDAGGAVVGEYRLSDAHTSGNLTVILVHGSDKLNGRVPLTLDEAMERKIVVVHETGNVNELAVENVSAEDEVFIQSGDIVKGGRQDRVIAFDFLIPRKSGKLPLASFCVESGRWRQRKNEAAGHFASSKECLSSRDLKLAARYSKEQGEVWRNVAETQKKLEKNVGAPVQSADSASSLQLTLENKKLEETIAGHVKALAALPEGNSDVVGFAFAVNGQVSSVDVFASPALFRKLWPKLAKAAAVEAVAELVKDKAFPAVDAEAFQKCMADADAGKESKRDVNPRVQEVTRESQKNVVFETRDPGNNGAWLHRSYMYKGDIKKPEPAAAGQLRGGQQLQNVHGLRSPQDEVPQQRDAQPKPQPEQPKR